LKPSGNIKALTLTNVNIELYKGTSLVQPIASSIENNGSFTWEEVDPFLIDGSDYKVRISDVSDSGVYGESDEFRIEEKSITVITPYSDTTWTQGNSADITWTSKGTISNVKIDLYKGTTFNQTIIPNTENDRVYTWTEVDPSLPDGSDYKVRISDANGSAVYGESAEFKIEKRLITITLPIGSTIWNQGKSADITWTYEGTISNVKIDLYKGNAQDPVTEIVPSTENDGDYTWPEVDTSLIDGSDYKVRISDANDTTVYAESAEFRIEEKSITVITPYSATTWTQGSSADITWSSKGTISNVKIDLYKGSTSNQTIISSTDNDGVYTWAEVDTSLIDGSDYIVKISDANDTAVYGESAEFRIEEISITVITPYSDTIWTQGSSVDITWSSKGTISNVKIDLYKGSTFNQTIISSTENAGIYTWTEVDTSLADGTDYKVRVSSTDDSSVYGESAEFTIVKESITVTEPTSSTIWTKGEEVEIGWTTSGSGSSQGVAGTGTGLNPSINQGGKAIYRFQRRAFQERLFLRNAIKERRRAEDVDSSGNRRKLSSNTIKPQGVSGEISSSVKEGDIVHKRAKDTGNINRKSSVGRVNLPVAPQVSTEKFTQSGNLRALGLSYVKIELYKGGTLKQTVAESTENDGTYTSTVDSSLEDGTDYKIRISNPNDSTSYGESEEFEINSSQEWSEPEKLSVTINYAPYGSETPFIHVSPEGREFLYFSSGRPPNVSSYYDLFVSEKINDVWQEPENLWTLNTYYRDQCPSLTADGNEIYYTSQRPTESDRDIWVSEKDTLDNWKPPEKVNISSQYEEGSPSVSADGLILYFSSNRPGSLGGRDIYVTRRESRSSPWSVPENIVEINTSGYESNPSISSDNLTLYFQRTMPSGYPDIYVAKRSSVDSPWEEPINLGSPVNTEYGEFSPSISPDGRTLYFAYQSIVESSIWITQLVVPPIQEASIDIKPGSFPNSINPNSKGVVPVAVLTTEDYDASTVVPDTVLFADATPVRWNMEDVDEEVTCLLPNLYQRDNFIEAGEGVIIPPPDGKFSIETVEPLGKMRTLAIVAERPLDLARFCGSREEELLHTLGSDELKELVRSTRGITRILSPTEWAAAVIEADIVK